MRRILVVTFYYRPDLSAGSFRMTAFVNALTRQAPDDVAIDVLTTMPNRYQSYDKAAAETETFGNVSVRRIPLPTHRSGFRDQANAFLVFYRRARKFARNTPYDLVFATSSRLMTAALGASLARAAEVPLYLDFRDIFTDTMRNLLKAPLRQIALPIFDAIERRTLKTADVVNLVSPGFAPYFSQFKAASSLRYFTNGIDPEFLSHSFEGRADTRDRPRIVYAGNFGEGQGLHRIIPGAALALADSHEFLLIGDGGRKTELLESCRDLRNVTFHDPVDRSELMRHYADADILFLHLNDHDAFRKVLPSKVFEYAATGKPVLAGVAGYAARFIDENIENAAVFEPCDVAGMVAAIGALDVRHTPRMVFNRKFARESIMQELAEDVLGLLQRAGGGQADPRPAADGR